MIKKTRILIILILIAVSAIVFYSFSDDDDFEISKNLDIYYTLFRELKLYYVDEVDAGDLIKTSINGMLKSLDPYTVYIPESRIEDYKLMTTGQYGGIGALIRKYNDYVVIAEIYENFPAFKAGLKTGDVIIEINGKSSKGKNTSDVSKTLKGQPDTPVKILIDRPGTENPVLKTIVRENIKIQSVPYHGMLNKEIGYIRLSSFTDKANQEVKKALIDLIEKQNATSILLDLRGNPGGLLIESVNIANLFVKKGEEIVSTKGKVTQWNKSYKTTIPAVASEIPVVVLVNSASASASEIVSGSFQDLDRGVIIGQRTYGKGLVQTSRQLSYNSKLKVTTAKYYIPSGRCIQALDYSHRNEDGSVGKIPDSLITEYFTKNGRKVYDGGGITPDIVLEPQRTSKITISLFNKNIIFDYATQYYLKHDTIIPPKDFTFTDDDYNKFIEFIADKDFDYKTKSEKTLNTLKEIAKKEKYYDSATEEFEALQIKIAHDKDKDLNTFKDEIKELIRQEIVSRYYYQKGRIEALLFNDNEINKAIEVLSNLNDYYSILEGSYKKDPNNNTK